MPRRRIKTTFKPTIKMELPFEGKPTRKIAISMYEAFSRWSEMIYPKVIASCPVYSGPDFRRRPGFVRRHIKLTWSTGLYGIKYKAIGVPRGSLRGTPQYHALMAIYALHYGWEKPFIRRPKTRTVMTFPLKKGERIRNPRAAKPPPGRKGPKTWIVTRKAVQVKGPRRNPFIHKVFRENFSSYLALVREAFKKKGRRKKKIEIT